MICRHCQSGRGHLYYSFLMTIIIFAGGTGRRLWPISRRHLPKQFGGLHQDGSTLQMAVERVAPFGIDHVYISTTVDYVPHVKQQVPAIANDHILVEPARRDLAAAVGLALTRLRARGVRGPVAVLWSDHFMLYPDRFVSAMETGEMLVKAEPSRFVFVGETPRFANHNLGWIQVGRELVTGRHEFLGWKYHPPVDECQAMYASRQWLWNTGYFIFDLDFVLTLYRDHQPEIYRALSEMGDTEDAIRERYPTLPALSFDRAIVEQIDPSQAVVLKVDLGWSDPGTLYALKEAMVPDSGKNFEHGNVMVHDANDCLVYNEEEKKLVAVIGLSGMIVVNTKNALLVCHKTDVPKIKDILEKLEQGGRHEYL